MLHYFVADYWTKRRPMVKTSPSTQNELQQQTTTEQKTSTMVPPRPSMPTEITRSASWESFSTTRPCSADWHSNKQSWSFSEDYVSFPSLIEDEKEPQSASL
ncbi:predicted protein [Lichtheimia corymbifera JMRC:FSU:9682]|uniref:Uncharacterized protein n=1 Tax=Lichtheimia corymbifera JMRC:FSU:9682 TaxID=1263082 RepID=A0A068RG17_9FUNG|nr:predicted protein [Lichtheimia corymbifera JMRC:FSU:9682]